jgi:UDP-N-acetylmuramate--alanine ligase
MPHLNLEKIKKIYFIGIGGIGVSAIARMMALSGKDVRGSDMSLSEVTHELAQLGIQIDHGQSVDLIPKDAELVIYTIAVSTFDPKLIEAIDARGILRKTYPEMLGIISADSFTIAISGTHGKTTTTAMVAKVFLDAGLDPTVIVGSFLRDQKSNFIAGKSKYFIVEACEYRRSFLNLTPTILVITTITKTWPISKARLQN